MAAVKLRVVGDAQRVGTRGAAGVAGADLQGSLLGGAAWTTRAVCTGTDPDALFVTGAAQRQAVKICAGCPVKMECLADALDGRVEFGVWGGMTERQRRALLKKAPEVPSWREVFEQASVGAGQEVAS